MKKLLFIILLVLCHHLVFAQKAPSPKILIHFISAANSSDSVICKVTLVHSGNQRESRQDYKYFIKLAPNECISMYCEPQDGLHFPRIIECEEITSRLVFSVDVKRLQLVKNRLNKSKSTQSTDQSNIKIGQSKAISINKSSSTTVVNKQKSPI